MTGSTERTDRGRPALADRPPVSRTGASDSADAFLAVHLAEFLEHEGGLAYPCPCCLVVDLVDVSGDCGDLRLDLIDEFCFHWIDEFKVYE